MIKDYLKGGSMPLISERPSAFHPRLSILYYFLKGFIGLAGLGLAGPVPGFDGPGLNGLATGFFICFSIWINLLLL